MCKGTLCSGFRCYFGMKAGRRELLFYARKEAPRWVYSSLYAQKGGTLVGISLPICLPIHQGGYTPRIYASLYPICRCPVYHPGYTVRWCMPGTGHVYTGRVDGMSLLTRGPQGLGFSFRTSQKGVIPAVSPLFSLFHRRLCPVSPLFSRFAPF